MDVTLVRVYLTEAENRLKPLMLFLHNEVKVRGTTVYRGIEGFGKSGHMYTSNFIDLSLNLPLVVEFFDTQEVINNLLPRLSEIVETDHILCIPAKILNSNEKNTSK